MSTEKGPMSTGSMTTVNGKVHRTSARSTTVLEGKPYDYRDIPNALGF